MRVLVGILLNLLLIGSLVVAFYGSPAHAQAIVIITINSDGSIDPSTSPISSVDNITYTLTDDIYGRVVVEKGDITIDGKGHTVEGDGTGNGFTLYDITSVTVKSATIRNFTYGVYVELAYHNVVSGNTIIDNYYDGVALYESSENEIIENTITDNGWYGVEIFYSSNNSISENTIANNYNGLWLYDSSDNTINQNKIITSSNNGIELLYASNNSIFLNYFANNTQQVYNEYSTNAWDNGWLEGNYWDNYNGTDLNGDGIGDTELPWEQVDDYPLMNPYVKGDVNHDAVVDIFDAISLSYAFGSSPPDFNWNLYCDMNKDEQVDIFDAITLAQNFGNEWNYP